MPPQRVGQLLRAQRLHPSPHLGQRRHRGEPGEPIPVLRHLGVDELLGGRQLAPPALDVRRHHGLQVVEIVEKDVVQLADRRIDVARHGDVENAERAGRRALASAGRTCSTSTMACGAAVEQTSTSTSASDDQHSSYRTATAPWRAASSVARSNVRFATIDVRTPCSARISSASSAISPAPRTIARFPASDPKICFANCTDAELTDAAPRDSAVSLRTRPAV